MSKRLTNAMRDAIISKAVSAAFDDRREAIKARKNAFADVIYKDVFDDKMRRLLKRLSKEHGDKFVRTRSWFSVNMMGQSHSVHMRDDVLWPHGMGIYSVTAYHADDEIAKTHQSIEQDDSRLKEDAKTFRVEVSSVVYNHTTVKNLLKAWPTLLDLMGKDFWQDPASTSTAVAIPTETLDAKLKAAIQQEAA